MLCITLHNIGTNCVLADLGYACILTVNMVKSPMSGSLLLSQDGFGNGIINTGIHWGSALQVPYIDQSVLLSVQPSLYLSIPYLLSGAYLLYP